MFGQVLKFVGFGQRVSELGRFKFRGVHVTPNFIVPRGKTMRRMQGRDLIYHQAKFGGVRISRAARGRKYSMFLFVFCPSPFE